MINFTDNELKHIKETLEWITKEEDVISNSFMMTSRNIISKIENNNE